MRSAEASIRSRTSSMREMSSWMSPRSMGVMKVWCRRSITVWVISSPWCSTAFTRTACCSGSAPSWSTAARSSAASRARSACCSKRSKNCSPPLAGRRRAKNPLCGAVAMLESGHSTATSAAPAGSAPTERRPQPARLGGRERGGRVVAVEPLERGDQRRRDRQVAIPPVVGRDHVPGRGPRAAAREELLVGRHVPVPERPLLQIARRELPVLARVGQALEEPAALLALADVEEELQDEGAVLGEDALEAVDLIVALAYDRARHGAMHARHQHVLVVRAVEDRDVPAPRGGAVRAPEEVVRGLLLGRHLEGDDLAAARVDAVHDVLDGAVLARRVHALEHDQHRVAAFGVEYVLELREPRDVAPELGARRALVGVLAGVGGVDPIEPDAGAGR